MFVVCLFSSSGRSLFSVTIVSPVVSVVRKFVALLFALHHFSLGRKIRGTVEKWLRAKRSPPNSRLAKQIHPFPLFASLNLSHLVKLTKIYQLDIVTVYSLL